jgi:hypothetical protein
MGYRKNWPQITARTSPAVSASTERARRLDQLSPLIHELLSWDLVVRTEAGEFVLTDDVQVRLAELSSRQAHPSTAIYVGRSCQRCGTTGITRLVEDVRLCPACARAPEPVVETPVELGTGKRRDAHSWWNRKVG